MLKSPTLWHLWTQYLREQHPQKCPYSSISAPTRHCCVHGFLMVRGLKGTRGMACGINDHISCIVKIPRHGGDLPFSHTVWPCQGAKASFLLEPDMMCLFFSEFLSRRTISQQLAVIAVWQSKVKKSSWCVLILWYHACTRSLSMA